MKKVQRKRPKQNIADVKLLIIGVCALFLVTTITGAVLGCVAKGDPRETLQMIERVATLGMTGFFAVLAGKRLW